MSKLPNAPLVEVVAELKWEITSKEELNKIQYLHGDIFNEVKKEYPQRESIIPSEIPLELVLNKPAHRFKSNTNKGYPLIQVGAGLVTLNTIDPIYQWETFFEQLSALTQTLMDVFPYGKDEKPIYPGILFLDFFPFDFDNNDAIEYVNRFFNLRMDQHFHEASKPPNDINFMFSYPIQLGNLIITLKKGRYAKKEEGILLQTRINGNLQKAGFKPITTWFDEAHEICSDLFKKLTEGELYESFK